MIFAHYTTLKVGSGQKQPTPLRQGNRVFKFFRCFYPEFYCSVNILQSVFTGTAMCATPRKLRCFGNKSKILLTPADNNLVFTGHISAQWLKAAFLREV